MSSPSQKTMIFIPAYNEEATVGKVVRELTEGKQSYDVIVVNDGSTDQTEARAREAGADVVSFPFHCGGSWAILAGYRLAVNNGYTFLAKVDGDGQHRTEDVSTLLSRLENDSDVVVGSRYVSESNSESVSDSKLKHWGRVVSSTVISSAVGARITDVTSGLRAWRCDVLRELLSNYDKNGYADDSVFWLKETLLLRRLGKQLVEVPVSIRPRIHGSSKSFTRLKMFNFPVRVIVTLLRSLFWR